jgi:hypothetical protein
MESNHRCVQSSYLHWLLFVSACDPPPNLIHVITLPSGKQIKAFEPTSLGTTIPQGNVTITFLHGSCFSFKQGADGTWSRSFCGSPDELKYAKPRS